MKFVEFVTVRKNATEDAVRDWLSVKRENGREREREEGKCQKKIPAFHCVILNL